jgi:hypothetical protein
MRNIKCKDILCLLLVALVVLVIYKMVTPSPPLPPPIVENWFGSDAWNWTKKTASKVGNKIGHAAKETGKAIGNVADAAGNMASAAWDGLVYETTKPAFGDTAAYEHAMIDWATKDSRGNPRGVGSSMGRMALGIGGLVPVVGLDAVQSAMQLPFKAIRYVGDADYRDHVFDHGGGFSNWFDNDYDATLHPLPAGRGHLAEQHHKVPFLPIRW